MQIERSATPHTRPVWAAIRALAVLCVTGLAATSASAATLERIRETGRIKFGYFADARPFTYKTANGAVEGYGASLCQSVAEQAKSELGLSDLTLDWVPVTVDERLHDIEQGSIDVLCTPTSVTLSRRREVSYSIPVFPGGARAVLRADAPLALREALADTPSTKPVWRGSPAAKTLRSLSIAAVKESTTQTWLITGMSKFQVGARLVLVPDFRTGLQLLRAGKVDVFFGDRSAMLGAMDASARNDFLILDRMFTHELYGLAVPRGDEDFRLLVDRALSTLYASGGIDSVYTQAFGAPNDAVRTFFRWNTLMQ